MKMGTILSPWRYDAMADQALQPTHLRMPTILHYALSDRCSQLAVPILRECSREEKPVGPRERVMVSWLFSVCGSTTVLVEKE
jgi:hypothetical protein